MVIFDFVMTQYYLRSILPITACALEIGLIITTKVLRELFDCPACNVFVAVCRGIADHPLRSDRIGATSEYNLWSAFACMSLSWALFSV